MLEGLIFNIARKVATVFDGGQRLFEIPKGQNRKYIVNKIFLDKYDGYFQTCFIDLSY